MTISLWSPNFKFNNTHTGNGGCPRYLPCKDCLHGRWWSVSCFMCLDSCKLTHRLCVRQALRMLHVHRVNEQLERAVTLVSSNLKENYIFYVAWFDYRTAKLIGRWDQSVVPRQFTGAIQCTFLGAHLW